MSDLKKNKLLWFIIGYVLLLAICIPAGIAGCAAILDDEEDCVWEDCARLMDLPSDPVCLELGDPGCKVVPQ